MFDLQLCSGYTREIAFKMWPATTERVHLMNKNERFLAGKFFFDVVCNRFEGVSWCFVTISHDDRQGL